MKRNLYYCVLSFLSIVCINIGNAQPSNEIEVQCGTYLTDQSIDYPSVEITCGVGTGNWYVFEGMDDYVTLDVLNATFDVEVGVVVPAGSGYNQIACGGDFPSSSNIFFEAELGVTYYIVVGNSLSNIFDLGTYELSLSCSPIIDPPENDDCESAIQLTVNEICVSTFNNMGGASESSQHPYCNESTFTDVWYSFVADSTSQNIVISNITGIPSLMSMAIYSGDCNDLDFPPKCLNTQTGFQVPDLIIGESYYIRIYFPSTFQGQLYSFEICLTDPNPTPENDFCENAKILECGQIYPNEDTYLATTQTDQIGCFIGTGVWYMFPGTGEIVSVNIESFDFNMEVGLAEGLNCESNLQNLSCTSIGNGGSVTFQSILGLNYYLYIGYEFYFGVVPGKFSIEVECNPVPSPPSYDDCFNALSLETNEELSCEIFQNVSFEGATDFSFANPCFGFLTYNNDIWLSFIATSETQILEILNFSDDGLELRTIIWDDCPENEGVPVECSAQYNDITNLIIGNEYFIQISTRISIDFLDTNFDVCITSPVLPPPNDICSQALSIPINENTECEQSISISTENITNSGGNSYCSSGDKDIWYCFEATNDILNFEFSNFDDPFEPFRYSIWEDCPIQANAPLECVVQKNFTISNLDIGAKYFVQIYSDNYIPSEYFELCVTTPLPIIIPPNDECQNAILLSCNDTLSNQSLINATVNSSMQNFGCNSYTGEIWYTVIGDGDTYEVSFVNNIGNLDLEISFGYNETSCEDNIIPFGCRDVGQESEFIKITKSVLGRKYYFKVANVNSDDEFGTFDVYVRCISKECPRVITRMNVVNHHCIGDSPTLFEASELLFVSVNCENQFGAEGLTLSWWYDSEYTIPYDYQLQYSGDNCDPQEITLYASIYCEEDDLELIAGQYKAILYPDFNDSEILIANGTCLSIPSAFSYCENVSVSLGGDDDDIDYIPSTGQFGVNNYHIENLSSLVCWEDFDIEVPYSCSDCTSSHGELRISSSKKGN